MTLRNGALGSFFDEPSSPGICENSETMSLIDVSGREFLTRLRISELNYLVRQTILTNLKDKLLGPAKGKAAARRGGLKSNQIVEGKAHGAGKELAKSASSSKRAVKKPDPSFEGSTSGESSVSSSTTKRKKASFPKALVTFDERGLSGKKSGDKRALASFTAKPFIDQLKCEEVLVDDELIMSSFGESNLFASGSLGQPLLIPDQYSSVQRPMGNYFNDPELSIPIPLPLKKPRKFKPKNPDGTPVVRTRQGNPRPRGKRCRKVYGTQRRELWCRQCKWKKSCGRYFDNDNIALSGPGTNKNDAEDGDNTTPPAPTEAVTPEPVSMEFPATTDYGL